MIYKINANKCRNNLKNFNRLLQTFIALFIMQNEKKERENGEAIPNS